MPYESDSYPSSNGTAWGDATAEPTTENGSENTQALAPIQSTESEQNVIAIEFIDLNLEPIVGLKYRLEYATERTVGVTDETGNTQALHDVPPGVLIDVSVFREQLQDFKKVGTICATGGECGFSIVSPKLRFGLDTELHDGAPGNAEDNKPPVPPTIETIAASSATTTPTPAPSATSDAAINVTPTASLPPAKPPTSGVAKPAKKQTTKNEPGRDKSGNPMVTMRPSTLDNVFKAVFPMYHIWSWWSERRTQPAPATEAKKPAAGNAAVISKSQPAKKTIQVTEVAPHQLINPAANLSQVKGEPLSKTNKEHLDALFKFVEAQTLIDYIEYKRAGAVTQKIILATKSDPPKKFPSKAATDTRGMCFAYVRAALHENRFVNKDAGKGQAKDAGIDLRLENYRDVTTELPQVAIEYPSGHSAAQYDKNEEIDAKRNIVAAKSKAEKWDKEKIKAALDKIGDYPEPHGVSHTQADIMYTLPGDIIVYKQVVPDKLNADGHIDIRTYHGFVSDFVWGVVPKLGGKKFGGKQYRVIGVYRKVSDEMAMVRVRAFLKAVRSKETEGYSDSESYFVLPDGKDAVTHKLLRRKFTDTNVHPFDSDATTKYDKKDYSGRNNTAAGAYQIKVGTWEEVTEIHMGWPKLFTPEMQERIAIFRLQQRPMGAYHHPRRTALGYIMEGDIESAVNKTGLWNEWSCLPRGAESKYTMEQLKADFEKYVKDFSK